jgi:hypothetical protein
LDSGGGGGPRYTENVPLTLSIRDHVNGHKKSDYGEKAKKH